jgi:hypothetical protein
MYRVTWEIDVDAKTPRAAAKEALRVQRDPSSIATVFDVAYHKNTKTKTGKARSRYVHDTIDLG